MSSVMQQLGFDYESLTPEIRTDVRESARRIHELERRTSESIIEIGQHLIRVKERLPHGEFLPWIETEFGWTRQSANNFIRVAERFSNVKNLDIYQPSALYALASNSVPDEVRSGFVEVADAGRPVTHSDVKEAIQEHRQPAPQPEPRNVVEVDADTGEILDDGWEEDSATEEPAPLYSPQPAPKAPVPHVSHNSGENEWYTPSEYLEAAREVLGTIDLDPASSDVANERVKATSYFTKEDNGLAHEWHGNVWINPPYAQPLISEFCEKVVEEFEANRVKAAIVLVNNATETRFFRRMAESAPAICFPTGRIKYLDSAGRPANTPLQGQAFVYFGDNTYEFISTFRQFGFVVEVA